jgi:hypothetical protein
MWWNIILYVGFTLLSYLLAPKPEKPKPAGLDEIDAPVAEAGKTIPVLFGTRDLNGPNVVWYGHLRTTPIKSGGKK